VALGFAALENVLYLFSNYDAWLSVGIVRALFSVPGHFFFGVLMGYYYSLVRFDPLTPKVNRILVLAAPILAHGAFNSLLFTADVMNPYIGAVLSIIFVAVCIKLRKYAGSKIREHLRNDGVIQ
jgi:RsiW-degrading membrane proteinase PrsW (M82 family)